MILAIAVAHWVLWALPTYKVGVAVEDRLILEVKWDCSNGVNVFTGHYGDMDKAMTLFAHSHACSKVEERKKQADLMKVKPPTPMSVP